VNLPELANSRVGYFSGEVIESLYETSVIEDHLKKHKLEANQGPEYDRFWQRYLTKKIVLNRAPLSKPEQVVRTLATTICKSTGNASLEAQRECVHMLCYQPHRILHSSPLPPFLPWRDVRWLLQGAIICDSPAAFKWTMSGPDFYGVIGSCPYRKMIELWDDPIALMASLGRTHFLEAFFTDRRLSRKTVRSQALGPAIRAGRLDIVHFILDPNWGPVDFIDDARLQDDLVAGMLRSPLVDYSSQILASLRSCSTSEVHESNPHALLDGVAFGKPERLDVVEWLLAHGAVVQTKMTPRQRVDSPSPKPSATDTENNNSRLPWNPLRPAVMSGNEKIVRLLLDQGANPNFTDVDVLEQAVKRGRIEIVRMLVQNGAGQGIDAKSRGPRNPKSLMKHAVATKNDELCQYISPFLDYV
jgi:hypothetical protein